MPEGADRATNPPRTLTFLGPSKKLLDQVEAQDASSETKRNVWSFRVSNDSNSYSLHRVADASSATYSFVWDDNSTVMWSETVPLGGENDSPAAAVALTFSIFKDCVVDARLC